MDVRPDDPTRSDEATPETEKGAAWRCGRCDVRITGPHAAISIGGKPARARYPNPAGIVWDVITVATVEHVRHGGPPTPAYSWFPGYHWRLLGCAQCGLHLGWRYDGTGPPATFWGLIATRLRFT